MEAKDKILTLAREIPLFSTVQAARYFSMNGSPSKRASETLKKLEREGLIEGRRREIGKPKVWRLSSTGRKSLGVEKPPLHFHTPKIEHVLALGDIFQELFDSGRLVAFRYEPKDEFTAGRKMIYAPDAFIALKEPFASYVIEYQRSPLSSIRWAQKWAVMQAFFEESYKNASWQPSGKIKIRPKVLAISEQSPEVVLSGSGASITLVKSIREIL